MMEMMTQLVPLVWMRVRVELELVILPLAVLQSMTIGITQRILYPNVSRKR